MLLPTRLASPTLEKVCRFLFIYLFHLLMHLRHFLLLETIRFITFGARSSTRNPYEDRFEQSQVHKSVIGVSDAKRAGLSLAHFHAACCAEKAG